MPRHYVTTAIDFPNAAPHMGHVMEKILADILVRWLRLSGHEVKFHVGTDENGIKIQQTAKELKMTPRELVEKNAPVFEDLFRRINISFDYFIRTADPKSHWPTVTELWKRLKGANVLMKRTYTGLYCNGCERFWREVDLVDGLCPDHKRAPEKVTEENWFYLLSKKQKQLEKLLDPLKGTYTMIPAWRGNETLAFLKEGLEDVSFSRSKETLSWGVPVPDDDSQVMYVWCDNLTSYISSLGYLTEKQQSEWWDDATVTHVIGKDIARFHALNWPAMLLDAGIKTPDRLLIHGFLTSEGQKMSKSLGNVVKPEDVLAHFGGNPDPLRFYLSHEVPVGNDGDFSWKRIDELYVGVLSNKIGNLLNRVLVLLSKDGGDVKVPRSHPDASAVSEHWKNYVHAMDAVEHSKALAETVALAELGNLRMEEKKPWTLKGEEKRECLSSLAEILRHITLMLLPFMPETAKKMAGQLHLPFTSDLSKQTFMLKDQLKAWGGAGDWKQVGKPEILFQKIDAASMEE